MFYFIKGDITKVRADAVVNAANTSLKEGGGVCGAIFKAAGARKLQKECDETGHCEAGNAVITSGYKLSKYIIHTVSPVWKDGTCGEKELLKKCYMRSLELVIANNLKTVAFPVIGAGRHKYPPETALDIAQKTISEFLSEKNICDKLDVYLVLYDRKRGRLWIK